MNGEDHLFLKNFFQQVTDFPLSPQDPRYVPIYEDPKMVGVDPVEVLARPIEWTMGESVQLFSGFRGTGKSTELRRLQQRLESDGHYVVLLCDIEDYLNLSTEVDVSDFLMAMAGAFSDRLTERGLCDREQLDWGTRLAQFFKRIRIEFSDIKVGVPGLSATIKANLKDDPDFKRRVQKQMVGNLAAFVNEVRGFFFDCVNTVKDVKGSDVEVAFLVDSVEHIRGTSLNAQEVQSSVETLFASHADKLHLPSVHVVYTVPPYLKVRYSNLGSLYEPGGVQVLPAFKLREKGGKVIEANFSTIERVVAARGDWKRLLGGRKMLDRLIANSGGHLRDLLRLVAEVLRRADRVPVSESTVTAAIDQVRTEFLPISESDARWLAKIAGSHQTALASVSELPTLARFLDTHLALCYRNGDEWYDIHPLIVDYVKERGRADQTEDGS